MLTREGSLQHGAIPLNDSYRRISRYLPAAPEATPQAVPEAAPEATPSSLSEELGRPVSFAEAAEAVAAGFAACLREQGVELAPGALSDTERATAEELYRRRYSQDAWNLMY